MGDLHLCNTHGQLLAALCDVVAHAGPVTLIYLDDEVPLPADMQTRLRTSFDHLTLHVQADQLFQAQFATLPPPVPAVIRRNLRASLQTPSQWVPDILQGQRFERAYIHNTGFFMAKVVAGLSDTVTLRESGLNNYVGRPVQGLKRGLRALSGYPADWQIMGEEPWVNHIAVARPDDLPARVRRKGVLHDLQARLGALSEAQKQTLLHCLSPDLPDLPKHQRTALLLTQPLDLVGMCDTQTKLDIYTHLTAQLRGAGFTVFLKNHPRDTPFTLEGTTPLDPVTPIELWGLTGAQPFDLGVALCSASLAQGTAQICTQPVQLVSADTFYPAHFDEWHKDIPNRLARAL